MMVGITVGISALTVLNVMGEATRLDSIKRFKNMLGTFDTVMVRPGAARTRGMVSLTNVPPTLKFEDAASIAAEVPEIKQVAILQNAFGVDVKYRDRSDSPAIFGVSANWQQLRGEDVADGRFISDDDIATRTRVAALGAGVVAILFQGEGAIGKTIRIGDVPFLVIGTLPSRGAGPVGASLDDLIVIPVTTAATRLFNRDFLTMIVAQLKDPEQADGAVTRMRSLLRDRHHIAPTALDDFTLTNPAAMMKNVTQMKSTLATLLKGVVVLATGIGCLVTLGLMLASVAQRRGAIGLARAVGATRGDVLLQFVLEAGWTALSGGLTGVFVGAAVAVIMTRSQGLPAAVPVGSLAQSLALALGLGLLGGLYPAWKAARVDPVLALRT
jgi:putative ABC transport system permease protein